MANTTEILEPIVGNSPKKLPVPQFNRDEVLEVVQDGIDKGKLELPPGGTKLYRHTISFQFETHSFVCEISTPITDFSNYANRKFIFENPVVDSNHKFNYGIGYMDGGGNKATIFGINTIISGGQAVLAEATAGVYDTITDTVTEL